MGARRGLVLARCIGRQDVLATESRLREVDAAQALALSSEFTRCLHRERAAAHSVRRKVYLLQRRETMNGTAIAAAAQMAADQEKSSSNFSRAINPTVEMKATKSIVLRQRNCICLLHVFGREPHLHCATFVICADGRWRADLIQLKKKLLIEVD